MGVESFTNPYPGLRPFEFPERNLFFGREGQSEELSRRLQQSRFLAVVGTSGSGKSSLVRAGLLPALYGGFMAKAGPRWRVAILRPGNDPIRNLAAALDKPADFGVGKQEASPRKLLEEALIESDLRVSSLGLLEYLKKAALPQDENLLIVVDQFEELFRFKKESQRADADDEAAGFVKLLLEAMRAEGSRVYVVITMRSDFLGDCAQFRDLPEAINEGQYLIPRMTRDQLRQAIVAPAKVYGAQLTTRLVNRLLNDIGDDQDQLPILQHALMRTWDEWERGKKPAEPLDFGHYEAIGGMAEALSRHADEAYEELHEERRKKIAERLFKCLTEIDRENRETRRRTTVSEVCAITKATREEVIPVVNTFRLAGRTFIMPPPEVALDNDSLLDISHESLIRNWKKLESWVKEEARSAQQYRRIVDAAELHEAGEIGYWQDPQLSFALKWRENERPTQEWASRYHPAFAQAMRFLDESKTEREKELAREKQRQEAELERERELREKAQLLAEANLREAEKAQALAAEQQHRAQIEIENAEKFKKVARRLRLAVVALALILLLASGLAVYAFTQKRQADVNASRANEAFFKQEKIASDLELKKNRLSSTQDELSKKIRQLATQEEELKKSLKTAEDERKRAEISEAEKADALVKANAAKDSAVQTLQREEKNRTGLVLFEQGKFSDAQSQFDALYRDYTNDRQLEEDKRIEGQWWALHNLGAIYGQLDDYEKAVEAYNKARALLPNATGDKRLNLIATLRRLGQLHGEAGYAGWKEGDKVYRELLENLAADESIKKANPRYEAEVKKEFADIIYSEEQSRRGPSFFQAKKLYQEALQIYKTYNREQNTSEIISILNTLAEIATQQEPAEAKAFILEALTVRENEAHLGPMHPDIAESYTELARFYQATKQPELAAQYDNLAARIRDWTFRTDKETSFPADKLEALAQAYRAVGKCDKAAQVYKDTVGIIEELIEFSELNDVSVLLRTLIEAARFHRDWLKDDHQAEVYFAQFVEKSEEAGFVDAVSAEELEEIALIYYQWGKYAEAEKVFRQAYGIYKERVGAGDYSFLTIVNAVQTLSNLARTLEAVNKQSEAEAKYREAIDLTRHIESLEPDSIVVPTIDLANLYLRQDKDREAEGYFKKVLTHFEAASRATLTTKAIYVRYLPEYVRSLIGLGRIEERKSPNAPSSPTAIEYFERALSALDKAKPGDVFGRYVNGVGVTTTDFYSDRADILEFLAKHIKGERAADLRKQAEEARQKIKAKKEREEAERKQAACIEADAK